VSGPEFCEAGRGAYVLDVVRPTPDSVDSIALRPDRLAAFLVSTLRAGAGLFAISDLRDEA
jgi:hypothetical protein